MRWNGNVPLLSVSATDSHTHTHTDTDRGPDNGVVTQIHPDPSNPRQEQVDSHPGRVDIQDIRPRTYKWAPKKESILYKRVGRNTNV